MENLNLQNIMCQTPTIFQMDDESTVKSEGILEDIAATIYS